MDGTHYGILIGVVAGWSLVIIATAKWTIGAGLKGLGEKICAQEEKIGKIGEKQHELEREVLNIKADLPLCYVRREDFIRNEVVINAKLDKLHDLFARMQPKKEE